MWSFSIYDRNKNILLASRDRFGIKPFYYYSSYLKFAWGSELRQLLPLTTRLVNKQILFDYLFVGYVHHTNETFFQDISSLKAVVI